MQLRPFAAWSELQRSLLLFFSVSWQALLCSERKRACPVMVDRWFVPALDLRLLPEHIAPQRRVHHSIAWVSQLICFLPVPFQLSLYVFSGQFALGSHSAFNTICMIGQDIPHSWPSFAPFFFLFPCPRICFPPRRASLRRSQTHVLSGSIFCRSFVSLAFHDLKHAAKARHYRVPI